MANITENMKQHREDVERIKAASNARVNSHCSDLTGSASDGTKRLEAAFVRIAKAHGIESPLVLIAMAENDEENHAEILARYIENKMQNNVDRRCEPDANK